MKVFVLTTLAVLGLANAGMIGMMMGGQNPTMRGQDGKEGDDRDKDWGDKGQYNNRGDMKRDQDKDNRNEDEMRPPRVWTFGVGRDWAPFEKLDREHMRVVGLGVDMIHAACKAARARCEFVFYTDYTDCWNSEHGSSPALMNRWFDACVNVMPTFEKKLVHAFSRSYTREPSGVLYVRRNDNLRMEDLRRPDNEIAIGFHGGSHLNARCLMHNEIVVNEDLMRIYDEMDDMAEALRSGQIRVAFTVQHETDENLFQMLENDDAKLQCALNGAAVMTRKDNYELLGWLNSAIDDVMRSPEYGRMCYIWEKIFDKSTYCMDMKGEEMGNRNGGDDNGDDENGAPPPPPPQM